MREKRGTGRTDGTSAGGARMKPKQLLEGGNCLCG